MNNYILDFYSPEYKLAIEADGGQHFDLNGIEKDKVRENIFSNFGIRVLRFNDFDILNKINSVCEVILMNLDPSPQSSPQGGEVNVKNKERRSK